MSDGFPIKTRVALNWSDLKKASPGGVALHYSKGAPAYVPHEELTGLHNQSEHASAHGFLARSSFRTICLHFGTHCAEACEQQTIDGANDVVKMGSYLGDCANMSASVSESSFLRLRAQPALFRSHAMFFTSLRPISGTPLMALAICLA